MIWYDCEDDQKNYSLAICASLAEKYKSQVDPTHTAEVSATGQSNSFRSDDCFSDSDSDSDEENSDPANIVSEEDASQAYYLAGNRFTYQINE